MKTANQAKKIQLSNNLAPPLTALIMKEKHICDLAPSIPFLRIPSMESPPIPTTAIWRKLSRSLRILSLLVAVGTTSAQTTPLDVNWHLNNGKATITSSPIDIGSVGEVFDGKTVTLARSQAVNPMTVTINFTTPKTLDRSRVWFIAGDNQWRIETADTIQDMDTASGTFQVALDWVEGPEWTWQDRNFAAPVTCRVVRLKLQRLTGDNYVHLNEWELYQVDRPFAVTQTQELGSATELTWNSNPGKWYEVQASLALDSWQSAGYWKAEDSLTTANIAHGSEPKHFYRVRKAQPEDRPSITKRVLVLNIDPVLEAHGSQRLNAYLGWNDPHVLTTAYLNDLTTASGGYVQWQVASWVDLDLWPKKVDGFQYSDEGFLQSWSNRDLYPFHSPDSVDYETLLELPLAALGNMSAHEIVASGAVDEVIYWSFPYSGFYESRMVGSTAYWCNAPALIRPTRNYIVMGLNPERGIAEALHSFGHRSESILSHVYGSWSGTSTVNHLWDRYTRVGPKHGPSVAGCGNIHYPPNASNDYDYDTATPVISEADRWLSYPDFSGPLVNVNKDSWGGPDYHRNYMRWWYSHIPKVPGRYTDPNNSINDGKLNNWWGYLVDFNEYAESR